MRLPAALRLPRWKGAMRFVPNIRYGTERYPEKVARRLRLANIAAWVGTLLTAGSAIRQYTGDYPGSWKLAAINATAALVFMAIPLLHRYCRLTAAIALFITGYA